MKKTATTRKRAAAKKTAAAKKASRGASWGAPKHKALPAGFTRSTTSSLILPQPRGNAAEAGVVPASKLQKGIAKAREQISGVLQELLDATRDGYEVTEIELSASFNADGKFLGFGVGGEMSITSRSGQPMRPNKSFKPNPLRGSA
jgi:hypothetical protein